MLPLEFRKSILDSLCQKIALGTFYREFKDHTALRRFASVDMTYYIVELMATHQHSADVTYQLVNLIWHGRLKAALPEVRRISLDKETESHTRVLAIKSVKEFGSKEDIATLLRNIHTEGPPYNRSLVAELVDGLEAKLESVSWVLSILGNLQNKKTYGSDWLGYALINFVERLNLQASSTLIKGIDKIIRLEPLIDHRYCHVSQQHSWLVHISAKAIEKLILHRHPDVFSPESLFVLIQEPNLGEYGDFEPWEIVHNLPDLISEWRELNYAVFWEAVKQERGSLENAKAGPLINFWQVHASKMYWSFQKVDFDLIIEQISAQQLADDRLVALSIALRLYQENGLSTEWLESIQKSVSQDDGLKKKLDEWLNPPDRSKQEKEWMDREKQWKDKRNKQEKERQDIQAKNSEWFRSNYEELRTSRLAQGEISQAQYYLYQRMRGLDGRVSMRWTSGNWRGLANEYGEEVATAFRDGLVRFWRTYTPALRSEENNDTTSLAILFGLAGLEIESSETNEWSQLLIKGDAELACRYAFHEINGLPSWFPNIHEHFPEIVEGLIVNEICWEFESESSTEKGTYVLSRVSWECEWLWDAIAEKLWETLEKEPVNVESLKYALKIIQRSITVSNQQLSDLARKKCNTLTLIQNLAHWYASWIGVDPENAVPSFASRLESLHTQDTGAAKKLAMMTIVNLVGDRYDVCRQAKVDSCG